MCVGIRAITMCVVLDTSVRSLLMEHERFSLEKWIKKSIPHIQGIDYLHK